MTHPRWLPENTRSEGPTKRRQYVDPRRIDALLPAQRHGDAIHNFRVTLPEPPISGTPAARTRTPARKGIDADPQERIKPLKKRDHQIGRFHSPRC